jgi:anti-sigma regulatory factor (Ser/Thr protein kinase)
MIHRLTSDGRDPMNQGMVRLSIDLPPDTESVGMARRFSDSSCRLLGLERVEENARLLVSELVGNAIRYATSEIRVCLRRIDGGRLRVEVHDDGNGEPRPAAPTTADPLRVSGRGLLVVDEVADRWHVLDSGTGGKTVWFELCETNGRTRSEERRAARG